MSLARAVLAASGAVAAFIALLPAAIAGLIALFDVSAHGLLGMSGTLLGLADPFGAGGGGLAAYRGVEVDLPRAALLSLLRGIPPIGMIALALTRPLRDRGTHWGLATGCGCAACLTAGWPAAFGLAAALVLLRQ